MLVLTVMQPSVPPHIPQHQKRSERMSLSRTNRVPFPAKLYRMLEETEARGLSSIVSWDRSGRAFRVHLQQDFVQDIMPHYFRQSKYKSFTRQLTNYGFRRITNDDLEHCGYYYHEKFVRGRNNAAWDEIKPPRKVQGEEEEKDDPLQTAKQSFVPSMASKAKASMGAPSFGSGVVSQDLSLNRFAVPQSTTNNLIPHSTPVPFSGSHDAFEHDLGASHFLSKSLMSTSKKLVGELPQQTSLAASMGFNETSVFFPPDPMSCGPIISKPDSQDASEITMEPRSIEQMCAQPSLMSLSDIFGSFTNDIKKQDESH